MADRGSCAQCDMEPDVLVMPARPKVLETWLEVDDWWLAVEVSGRGSRVYDREFKRTRCGP